MPDLRAPDYLFARFVIERGLGLLYVIAFVVAAVQFPALCGERGLDPAPRYLNAVGFWRLPSLFHLGYSDRGLVIVAWTGAVIAALIVLGLPQRAPLPVTMLAWLVLWALYLSIINIGGTFYGFGWETLLCEAGFLAVFLGNARTAPPWPILFAFRWLAFRVEFGAGLIKLRGDACWRNLTCMEWHQETQPMPNPLSWFFYHLPRPIHRVEVVGNFVAQLVLPWGLALPQLFATAAALGIVGTQLYLVVSGNYAWLNWLTIVIAFAAVRDDALPRRLRDALGFEATAFDPTPGWFTTAVLGLSLVVLVLSIAPVRNLLSPNQAMNASFDPFRLVNTYGAFGSVGRERYEVIIEGTVDEDPGPQAQWREYEFKGKPGDPHRMPRQFAPYHLRLDWLMWFLPLSPQFGEGWFEPFLAHLLEGDPATLKLLRTNPFPDRPPVWIRARMFRYRYTTWEEWRRTGDWWVRSDPEPFVGPVRLPNEDVSSR
jgi:hypothetical protein